MSGRAQLKGLRGGYCVRLRRNERNDKDNVGHVTCFYIVRWECLAGFLLTGSPAGSETNTLSTALAVRHEHIDEEK